MSEDTIEDCLICLEPMNQRVLLPCGHSPTCLRCFVTYNQCYGKRICPFCQREITNGDPIIIDSPVSSNYADELKKDYTHNDEFHYYYKNPKAIEELKSFQTFKCKLCGYTGKNFNALQKHLKKAHQKSTCKICQEANRFLPSEIPIYNQSQLRKHMNQHPKCPVCPFIGFDHSHLTEHMRNNHFRCDICADQGKILWFPTLDLIQVHFHTCHYACEDPMCVQQGFIVFATEVELQMHRMNVHGDKSAITLDFKEEAPPPEPNYKNEHKQRINQAKKKLKKSLKQILDKNEEKIQAVFNLIEQVQNRKVTVHNFLNQISEICGEATDGLFCDIAAAIGNPRTRASVVKARQGIHPCRLPSSVSMPEMTNNFPTISQVNDNAEAHHKQSSKGMNAPTTAHTQSNDDEEPFTISKPNKQAKPLTIIKPTQSLTESMPNTQPEEPRKTDGKKKQKRIILSDF